MKDQYLEMVDKVTKERIYNALNKLLMKKGTLVVLGGNISEVESLHNIEVALK